ncbi:MAG TPA: hypothetical protein VFL83_05085 [Anaeromyxobacter sp.]|nr:hypothetical protein [Anaeromyxobacter sp.]
MVSRILAYRPASVVERLGPRSGACPLSTRELLGAASGLRVVLPVVRAPVAAVIRGVLVAAKELQATVGLALPAGATPETWFSATARIADEVATGLPIFLCGEIRVDGEGATQVERAVADAWRLVRAGITHLAVDASAVAPEERGRVVGEVVAPAAEHGAAIDVVVPLADGAQAGRRAAAILDELARRGAPADLASVRCLPPADEGEARLQAGALARISQALKGVPVMRRGAVTAALLDLLAGSPVKACEDGGGVAARALALLPESARAPGEGRETRQDPLERAAAELAADAAERLEALAYMDALDFLERLRAPGSALALARELEAGLASR